MHLLDLISPGTIMLLVGGTLAIMVVASADKDF